MEAYLQVYWIESAFANPSSYLAAKMNGNEKNGNNEIKVSATSIGNWEKRNSNSIWLCRLKPFNVLLYSQMSMEYRATMQTKIGEWKNMLDVLQTNTILDY